MKTTLAVIGGSGFYHMHMPGLNEEWTVHPRKDIKTPFGPPSDNINEGVLGGTRVLFLARHGKGHTLTPSEVPYQANTFALKELGAEWLLDISAVGSYRPSMKPGQFIVVNHFIDRTKGERGHTFFGKGIVGHVQFADPGCPTLRRGLVECAVGLVEMHKKGALVVIEGPRYSDRKEAAMHRAAGADLVGETSLPGAELNTEAELHHATVALSTDWDCGDELGGEVVSSDAVVKVVKKNVAKAQALVARVAGWLAALPSYTCKCDTALDKAMVTAREHMPPERVKAMWPIFGRVLGNK